MSLASRHSIMAEEQGAQQEWSSTLFSLLGVCNFNINLKSYTFSFILAFTSSPVSWTMMRENMSERSKPGVPAFSTSG